MIIRNNTEAVTKNKSAIEDGKKGLIKHNISYATTTDLTAKGEAKKAVDQEESLIKEYKKVLERDLKNIAAVSNALQKVDRAY